VHPVRVHLAHLGIFGAGRLGEMCLKAYARTQERISFLLVLGSSAASVQ
jgi:hypothetical protein